MIPKQLISSHLNHVKSDQDFGTTVINVLFNFAESVNQSYSVKKMTLKNFAEINPVYPFKRDSDTGAFI